MLPSFKQMIPNFLSKLKLSLFSYSNFAKYSWYTVPPLNYKGSDRVLIHQGNKARGPNLPRIKTRGSYPENFSTLLQRGLLVDMTSRRRTTSNQRWKNVVYLNVNVVYLNVELSLRISTLMWTTLDNVETVMPFSTSSFTTLVNVETTLWK